MTQARRHQWISAGQWTAGLTIGLMVFGGAVAYVTAQMSPEYIQAATNATVAAQLSALSDRVGKLEQQNNYVLMALVGSLITQLVQLRTSRK